MDQVARDIRRREIEALLPEVLAHVEELCRMKYHGLTPDSKTVAELELVAIRNMLANCAGRPVINKLEENNYV